MQKVLTFLQNIPAYAAYAKKSVLGASTAILAIIAVAHPAWSIEAGIILGSVVTILGTITQYKAKNAPKASLP